jgi:ATP-dependent helicase/DNAse subunit B
VVIDYKSSTKRLDDTLMAHGIQLQLASYLNVLRCLPETAALFEIGQIVPAGVFYVNLRGQFENGKTRRDVLKTVSDNRKSAYRHIGRFDANIVRRLDRRDVKKGDQFNYSFNQDGSLSKVSREARDAASFEKLLDSTENSLFKIGRAILAGVVCVDPYTKGGTSACDQCQYQTACRIDPWTHEFRVLKPGS